MSAAPPAARAWFILISDLSKKEGGVMKNRWHRILCGVALIVLLSGTSLGADGLSVSGYELQSKARVGRTTYEYTYKATATNAGADMLDVTASVVSSAAATVVVDGDLVFGDVPSGGSVQSADTFTIRQDRRYPFDPASLTWEVTGVGPLRIRALEPATALPGDTIRIIIDGLLPGEPFTVEFSGSTALAPPASSSQIEWDFVVPEGANSGPLYIEQGARSSNTTWLPITSISVVEPETASIVVDETGTKVAIGLVLVSMKDGHDSREEANRVAGIVGGTVVGQIPLLSGYQIKFEANDIDDFRSKIALIEADPVVDFVLEDQPLGTDTTDWSTDPGLPNQREVNRVKEGAELYNSKMSPTDSSKLLPYLTAIGVIEGCVDYDAADFDGYSEKGLARSSNIAIYGIDSGCGPSDHGSVVTGIIAAEIGDGESDETGKNAGLLQGLAGAHAGFNLRVTDFSSSSSGEKWVHNLFAAVNDMLESGATVINWSFGIHKAGSVSSDGDVCTSSSSTEPFDCRNANIRSVKFFDSAKKAFEKAFENMKKKYPRAVIVASAGNGNMPNDPNYRLPTGIPRHKSESMIVVGAHTNDTTPSRESYSDFGDRVDISASGHVRTSDGSDGQGTSYAAPLVTATVAAIQSIHPALTPAEIRGLLRKSALPIENRVPLTNQPDDPGAVGSASFTAPLTPDEVGTDATRLGKGARLNVEGAIQAAIDAREGKTVPASDTVSVDLPFLGGDVKVQVSTTVTTGSVFDKADVLFLVDVSGSYGDDLAQFRSKATAIANAFSTIGRDVKMALASFSDFPIRPYGSASSGDYAYRLEQNLTSDTSAIVSAINGLRLRYGGDGPESQLEALYQAATTLGWRSGALPVIFLATDASFHDSDSETAYPGAGWTETVKALTDRGIQVYGLQSGGNIGQVLSIAAATGGESFSMSRNSAEIVAAVETAIDAATSVVDLKLLKAGDFADLIQSIEYDCSSYACNATGDGYVDVPSGETRTFDVTFSRHWFAKDETADHVFAMRLEVVADEVAVIQEIPVIVHVKFR